MNQFVAKDSQKLFSSLLMIPTLAVSQPLNGLQPLLAVLMSTQVEKMPVLVLLMMTIALVLKVVTLGQSPELLALSTRE